MKARVLDVGQCSYDHRSIQGFIQGMGGEVLRAHTSPESMEILLNEKIDLVLINRILDRDGSGGVDLIRKMKEEPRTATIPVMLISNFPEAQDEAESVGALRGFGKSELITQRVRELLAPFLEGTPG